MARFLSSLDISSSNLEKEIERVKSITLDSADYEGLPLMATGDVALTEAQVRKAKAFVCLSIGTAAKNSITERDGQFFTTCTEPLKIFEKLKETLAPRTTISQLVAIQQFQIRRQSSDETIQHYIDQLNLILSNITLQQTEKELLLKFHLLSHTLDKYRKVIIDLSDSVTLAELTKALLLQESKSKALEGSSRRGGEQAAASSNAGGSRPRHSNQNYRNNAGNQNASTSVCKKCSRQHGPICPAKNSKCRACSGMGHWAMSKACPKKHQHQASAAATDNATSENVVTNFFSSAAGTGGKDDPRPFACVAILSGGSKRIVRFCLDSGTTKSIIPRSLLPENVQLVPCNLQITDFAGRPMLCQHQATLHLRVKGKVHPISVLVVNGDQPLLSLPDCRKLGLVHRIASVNHGLAQDHASVSGETSRHILSEFPGIDNAPSEPAKVPPHRPSIDREVAPVRIRRSLPLAKEKIAQEQVENLLERDFIELAPEKEAMGWLSPPVLVKKDGGKSHRLCISLVEPNKAIIAQHYSHKNMGHMLTELPPRQCLAKIDCVTAFWQLLLHPDARPLTNFSVGGAVYRWKRICFGLKTASEAFQAAIDTVLHGIPGTYAFQDDILLIADSTSELEQRIRLVLKALDEANLKINPKKSVFGVTECDFVGHRITPHGIEVSDRHAQGIRDYEKPSTPAQASRFVGMVAWLSKFIPNLSAESSPLRHYATGKVDRWGPAQDKSFEKLKSLICTAPTLGDFSPDDPTKLVVDASIEGLGASILQERKPGEWFPIMLGSRALCPAETRYSNVERELLGCAWALDHWYRYTAGREILLETDCKPLLGIVGTTVKCNNPRLQRLALACTHYDVKISHVDGVANILADALSRSRSASSAQSELIPAPPPTSVATASIVPQAIDNMAKASLCCPEIQKIVHCLTENLPLPSPWTYVEGLEFSDGLLQMQGKVVVPQSMRQSVLQHAHLGHIGIVKMKALLRASVYWPGLDKDVEKLAGQCEPCQKHALPDRPPPCKPRTMPPRRYEQWSVDGFHFGGQLYLTCLDTYSKWPAAYPIPSESAMAIKTALADLFSQFGNAKSIVSDNGTGFRSGELSAFLSARGIRHEFTAVRHPQANPVERFHRFLRASLSKQTEEGETLPIALSTALQAYRAAPHAGTGQSPALRHLGVEISIGLPALADQARYKRVLAETFDQAHRAQESMLSPGSLVLFRGPGDKHFSKKGVVTQVLGAKGYAITDVYRGRTSIRARVDLKEFEVESFDDSDEDSDDGKEGRVFIPSKIPEPNETEPNLRVNEPFKKLESTPVLRRSNRVSREPERLKYE